MITTLIDPSEVIEMAYSNAEYTPELLVTQHDIITAEQRYLVPVIGEALVEALRSGSHTSLMSDYVAPALALYVREVVNSPTAPRSNEGRRRARAMMLRLSDYLDDNNQSFSEYDMSKNVLKRCRIDGVHVQIR